VTQALCLPQPDPRPRQVSARMRRRQPEDDAEKVERRRSLTLAAPIASSIFRSLQSRDR
jgi:hypothetical protein